MAAADYDVIVVGGGPGGLAAAGEAHRCGAAPLILEREERLGGILKQCIHDGFGLLRYEQRLTGPEYARGEIRRVDQAKLPRLTGAYLTRLERAEDVWRLTVITPAAGVETVTARALVMATGCRERSDRQVFLQGDRPAGIFTAGQAQRLINIDGYLPGRRVVILGSGDIGLIMARRFTLEGAEVLGVFEIEPEPSGLPRNVAQCLEDFDIPLHLRSTVTTVTGRHRVEGVTVCPVDERGVVQDQGCYRIACDTLVLSVGLIPENDILLDRGTRLDPTTQGPFLDQHRRGEEPGLHVCGNAAAVYDLVDYVSECGTLAGRSAAAWALGGAEPAPSVPLAAGGHVRLVLPQFLSLSAGKGACKGAAREEAARDGAGNGVVRQEAAGEGAGKGAARQEAALAEAAACKAPPDKAGPAEGGADPASPGDEGPAGALGQGEIPLYARVRRRIERANVRLTQDGRELYADTARYVKPQEMQRIPLDPSVLTRIDPNGGPVQLSMEEQ